MAAKKSRKKGKPKPAPEKRAEVVLGQPMPRAPMVISDGAPPKVIPADSATSPQSEPMKEDFPFGLIVTTAFKWLMLLMFTLLADKLVDTIKSCCLVGATPIDPYVLLPWHPAFPAVINCYPNHSFLISLFLAFVVLAFAFRYLICAIDPIERAAELHTDNETVYELRRKLKVIPRRLGILTLVIAFLETGLLLLSSVSLASPQQTATYLLILVAIDSLLFFLFLPVLALILKRELNHKYALEMLNTLRDGATNVTRKQVSEIEIMQGLCKKLSCAVPAYGLWNWHDFGVLVAYSICRAKAPLGLELGIIYILFFYVLLVVFRILWRAYRKWLKKILDKSSDGEEEELTWKKCTWRVSSLSLAFSPFLVIFVSYTCNVPWFEFTKADDKGYECLCAAALVGAVMWIVYLNLRYQAPLWKGHVRVLFYAGSDESRCPIEVKPKAEST